MNSGCLEHERENGRTADSAFLILGPSLVLAAERRMKFLHF